jgi:four helix bundle protein
MKVKDYKDLKVWQKGIEIVDTVFSVTDRFPKDEIYGLTNQMRRAAVSIPSNISEGFVRNHSKEYLQFLYIAVGSCAELDTQLIIAKNRNYVAQENYAALTEGINHEIRMLMSLINSLKRNCNA